VSVQDQQELRSLVSGGRQQVRVVLRALALLQLAKGVSAPRIARMLSLTPQAIRKVGHRYQQGGLERALYDQPRPVTRSRTLGSDSLRSATPSAIDRRWQGSSGGRARQSNGQSMDSIRHEIGAAQSGGLLSDYDMLLAEYLVPGVDL
jgi:hypothetical protein